MKPRTPAERAELAREILGRLVHSADVDAELRKKSDGHIATLLLEHVWAQMDCLGPDAVVVAQAIDRLRRTGAGPMPEPTEEDECSFCSGLGHRRVDGAIVQCGRCSS